MDIPGYNTDSTSALSATSTPVFSDNVRDLLGVGTLPKNPTAIITVNSTADVVDGNYGVTTLREAINRANADNGEDLIVFDRSLFSTAQTITLSLAQLDITHSLDIIAPRDTVTGADLVSISGNNASRVFDIETGATVTLSGLIITGGSVTRDNGGGISNSGNLNLDSTIVSGNNVISDFASSNSPTVVNGYGGGIYNTGTLNLSNSTVSNNTAKDGTSNGVGVVSGGGIYNNSGSVVISNSTVSGNRVLGGTYAPLNAGGGIYSSGSLVISNSTLSNSTSGNQYSGCAGGSIYNSGTADVTNSSVSGSASVGQYSSSTGGSIYNSGSLNVSDSTISGSASGGSSGIGTGGGIYNTGTAAVTHSTISNSSGGGIYNSKDLTVSDTTIANNAVSGGVGGGGILNAGNATVSNSTINNNQTLQGGRYLISGDGGGISNSGTITVSNTTISGNTASVGGFNIGGNGGGIANSGISKIINSTISGNTASRGPRGGGGILNSGTIEVINSTISSNNAITLLASYNNATTIGGGGILNLGTITVSNSTISGNTTFSYGPNKTRGGGILNSGTSTITNSTLSGNSASASPDGDSSATGNGGGIYNTYTSTVTLLFATVTQNTAANGGGVYQDDVPPTTTSVRGSFNVRNTIIAANLNSAGGVNPDVSGTLTSNGYNLIGSSTGSTGFDATGDIVGTSDNPIDPRLAPLDFYGGDTQTIALLPDSPAIDAADPTVLDTDPTTDQRGFPRISGARADIGAFEFST